MSTSATPQRAERSKTSDRKKKTPKPPGATVTRHGCPAPPCLENLCLNKRKASESHQLMPNYVGAFNLSILISISPIRSCNNICLISIDEGTPCTCCYFEAAAPQGKTCMHPYMRNRFKAYCKNQNLRCFDCCN